MFFDFSKNWEGLSDSRFYELIQRPFYVENEEEYAIERAAIILSFLDQPNLELENLPKVVSGLGTDAHSAIENYIELQSDEFQFLVLFQIWGYSLLNQLEFATNISTHALIEKMILRFLQTDDSLKNKLLAADVIMRGAYSDVAWSKENIRISEETFSQYMELILSSHNVSFSKGVCDILFFSNVYSSVHHIKDWLTYLRRFVTHPNIEVQNHAIKLFDEHFQDIWSDLVNMCTDKNVRDIWFSPEAIKKFKGKSKYFDSALSMLSALIKKDNKLTNSHIETINRRIAQWSEVAQTNLTTLSTEEVKQKMLPQFNWSKYV